MALLSFLGRQMQHPNGVTNAFNPSPLPNATEPTALKAAGFATLLRFNREVGSAPVLADLLEALPTRLSELLRLGRSALLMPQPETEELLVVAAHGFSLESLRQLRGPASLLHQMAAGTEPARLDGGSLPWPPPSFHRQAGVTSLLRLPLWVDGKPWGLLIGDRCGEAFHLLPEEWELATAFLHQAALWVGQVQALSAVTAAPSRFRDLLELAPDAILLVDRGGRLRLVNGQAERMFGYGREELVGLTVETLIPERSRGRHRDHRARYHQEPRTRPMGSGLELFARRKDGSEFPVEISLSPSGAEDGAWIIAIIRDVSERKRTEEERARLLASERHKGEQLKLAIREAHHRIKNNLQSISDLLYLELASGGSVSVEDVLRESVERIQSIALVHDLLTHDEDVQTVDLRALTQQLVPMVLRNSRPGGEAIQADIAVPSLPVSSKKATTLALILNELVSNAVKHAFRGAPAGEKKGRLHVGLRQAEEGLVLQVSDNGPGLPEGFDLNRDASVGLQVVRTLAERDLAGKLRLSPGPGLVAQVWFPW